MANPFDRFDGAEQVASGQENPFDRFDAEPISAAPEPTEPVHDAWSALPAVGLYRVGRQVADQFGTSEDDPRHRTWGEAVSDTGVSALKGGVQLVRQGLELGRSLGGQALESVSGAGGFGTMIAGAEAARRALMPEVVEDVDQGFLRPAQEFWQDAKSEGLKAQEELVHNADGFVATLDAAARNPGVIGSVVAEQAIPLMLQVGVSGRVAQTVAQTAGRQAAAKAAGGTAVAMEAGQSAGAAGIEVREHVMETPVEVLRESPAFADLEATVGEQEARRRFADHLAPVASAIAGASTALISKYLGDGSRIAGLVVGDTPGLPGAVRRVAGEVLSEGLQEPAEGAAGDYAKSQVDPTADPLDMSARGREAALGMMAGAGQAAGIEASRGALGNVRRSMPMDEAPDAPDMDAQMDALNDTETAPEVEPEAPGAEPGFRSLYDVMREHGIEPATAKPARRRTLLDELRAQYGRSAQTAEASAESEPVRGPKQILEERGLDLGRQPEEQPNTVQRLIDENRQRRQSAARRAEEVAPYSTVLEQLRRENAGAVDGAFDRNRDDLLTAVAKLGGLDPTQLGGEVDVATMRSMSRVGTPVIRGEGQGKTLDHMAESLTEVGFRAPDGGALDPNSLVELLDTASRGDRVFTADSEREGLIDPDNEIAKRWFNGDAGKVENALQKYIDGRPLTPNQQGAVDDITDHLRGNDGSIYRERDVEAAKDMDPLTGEIPSWYGEIQDMDPAESSALAEDAANASLARDFEAGAMDAAEASEHAAARSLLENAEYSAPSAPAPVEGIDRLVVDYMMIAARAGATDEQIAQALESANGNRAAALGGLLALQTGETTNDQEPLAAIDWRYEQQSGAEPAGINGRPEPPISVYESETAADGRGTDQGGRVPSDQPDPPRREAEAEPPPPESDPPVAEAPAEAGVSRSGDQKEALTDGQVLPPPESGADRVDQAAAQAEANPTEAQKEAGNYRKGHVRIQGMDITIENPKGSTRSGTALDGTQWESPMAHHYGYIKRTEGADGDHVDVFIGPDTDSQNVYVIDQVNADGTFDEHKVMLGFRTQKAARDGYRANYEKGWKVGPTTKMTVEEFRLWLAEGDTTSPVKKDRFSGADKQPAESRKAPSRQTAKETVTSYGDDSLDLRRSQDRMAAIDRVLTDDEIASQPLSKLWPKQEVDAIEDTATAAMATVLRDSIPSKPRNKGRVKRWVETVKSMRELMRGYQDDPAGIMAELRKLRTGLPIADRVEVLTQIDRKDWSRVESVEAYPDAYRFDKQGNKEPMPSVDVRIDGRREYIRGKGTVSEAMPDILKLLGREQAAKRIPMEIRYTTEYRGDKVALQYFISKKGDPGRRALKTFESAEAAREYLKNNRDELEAEWERVKERDNVKKTDMRRRENRGRVGMDHRNGKDVSVEDFHSTFGLRHVDWGKWVSDKGGERQSMLNRAYDAFMDLANITGLPPAAIGLNGDLIITFGKRGAGAAAAHFETVGQIINLTKTKGAGSLAHEWFHALDNYFQKQHGPASSQGDFITYNPEPYYLHRDGKSRVSADKFEAFVESQKNGAPNRSGVFIRDPANWQKVDGIRPEVLDKFAKLVQALDASPMRERAARIDNGKPGYWSRIIERAARSFESYVIAKMQESGQHNDFLANVVDVNRFVRNPDRYPYLLDSEMAPVQEAFDALFQTIETRETESGTAMFSVAGHKSARTAWQPNFPKAIISLGAKEFQSHPDYRAAKDGDIAAAVRLAKDSLKKGDMVKIKRLAQGVKGSPILVPVHAEEAVSVNQIPLAASAHVGKELGWDVDAGIVQAEKVGRGGGDGFYRLANQPHFVGDVEPGRSYVLLDDTLTQGGTFAALKGHIEANGGRVIGVVAMSGKQYSSQLSPTSDTLETLRKRWPELEGWWNEQFGYGFDQFTESEARYLARVRVPSLDALRDRILAARQTRVAGGSPPPTGRDGPLSSAIQSPEARPSAGLSASGVQESVRRAVGSNLAPSIQVVQTESDLPSGLMPTGLSGRVEGVFEPKTGQVHLVADNLVSPERAAWVAWHELWHRGIRSVDGRPGKLPGSVEGGALRNAIERASLHRTVARVADAIMTERGIVTADRPIAVEEALAELNAADETGDYGQVEQRYGVRVPPGMRSGVRGHIARFLDAVRRVLARLMGRPTATVTDGEVWQIITGARDGYGGGGGPGAGRPLFSVTSDGRPDTEAARRQRSFMEGIASQPIDRMFRLPFDVAGMIDSHGRLKYGVKLEEGVRRLLTEWRPHPEGSFSWLDPLLENARAGLIDRYGLSDEYKQRWRQTETEVRQRLGDALELFKGSLSGMSAAEAKVLQAVLTGEQIPEGDWGRVAEPIRRAIDDMGQEAVRLGLISGETYERNRGTYLHRSYLKHEDRYSSLSRFANRLGTVARRRIQGNALKARGIDAKVAMADLKRAAPPDWWRTKMQEGKADPALRGHRFILFERLEPVGEGVDTLEGMESGGPRRRRVLERHYWPADQKPPARYQSWENRGTWEVRDTRGGNAVLWRDYTKAERERMGEILDARYNIVKTFETLAHDLAMGRFFQDIAKNQEWFQKEHPVGGPDGEPTVIHAGQARLLSNFAGVDWVQVPDMAVGAGGGAKRWGALSGGFVRAEVWRDLNELDKMQNAGAWRTVMNQWKLNKTVRSPVTHMNNVMSNLMFMDLADVRATDLVRGIHAYVTKSPEYRDALVHGAFEANFVKQELNRKVLQPILDELVQEAQKDADTGTAVGLVSKLAYGIGRGLKTADNGMASAYEIEDEVFRMATYMRRLDQGDAPAEAAAAAREQFLDYDIRAPWVNAARRTVLPFISYTYRAVPVIAQSLAHRPWKLAKYATLAYLANAMAYALAPGDEDEERRTMREDQQGDTWMGTPRMMRMPWRDEYGNPVFMDIRRWIPAGDVFDMNQGQSALPIPAPLQAGGPLMLGAELLLNKQAFTGREIVDPDTDSARDIAGKVADWAWKSWMPSAAYIPGSYYWEKAWTAGEGGRDIQGRPYSLGQALASSIGVKVQPHDVQLGYAYRGWNLQAKVRGLRQNARQLSLDLNRGLIKREKYDREIGRVQEKLRRVEEEAQRLRGQ